MSRGKPNIFDGVMRRLRELQGDRTQKEFAQWWGESPARVNNYFTGVSVPKLDALLKLVQKGVVADWLLLGIGEPYRIVNAGRVHEPPHPYGEKHLHIGTEQMAMLRELQHAGITSVEEVKRLIKILSVMKEKS